MTRPSFSKPLRLTIVGRGRVGTALARALTAAGLEVEGPLGRGDTPSADVVLLCVPDAEITDAAHVRARFNGRTIGLLGRESGLTVDEATASGWHQVS